MRDIKFRAWDEHSKSFARLEIKSGNEFFEIEKPEYSELPYQPKGRFENMDWQQYTGLKDKNGKEIYDGDIVQTYALHEGKEVPLGKIVDGNHIPVPRVVEWRDKQCAFNISWDRWNGYEVIGNIYENPELINKGE